ncbi:MAG: MarR family winged helix-turn-helix transcriptional regulator [Phycisphaerae bacterium]
MQLLRQTTNPQLVENASHQLVSGVPPIIWFIRHNMRPHRKGLSLQQFRALVLVDRQPDASLSDIAEQLSASLPTTSRLIAGLVAKGMVTRKGCCEDRRQLELVITRLGRDMLDSAWAAVQKRIEQELGTLSEAQLKTVLDSMKILQGIFGSLELPDREIPHHRTKERTGHRAGDKVDPPGGRRARPLQRASK